MKTKEFTEKTFNRMAVKGPSSHFISKFECFSHWADWKRDKMGKTIKQIVGALTEYMQRYAYSYAENKGLYDMDMIKISTKNHSIAQSSLRRRIAINTGNESVACNSDYRTVTIGTGKNSIACNTGFWVVSRVSGKNSVAGSTGRHSKSICSNDGSVALSNGYMAYAIAETKGAVAIATGYKGQASGVIGSWLVLAERDEKEEIVSVKTFYVDGVKVKENTYYELINGEPTEIFKRRM